MNNNSNQQQLLSQPNSVCEDCNYNDRLIIHSVARALKSAPQKLCTSCVLSHYRASFCAQCFELYDANSLSPPPLATAVSTATSAGNNRVLRCTRCDNWTHFGCPGRNVPKSPYICPPCMSPNYNYFDYRKPRNQAIDKEASKQLLGAARISAVTVSKAAVLARTEAEKRAKVAAVARKRAREAIDHVMSVATKVETAKRSEVPTGTAPTPKGMNYVPVRLEGNGGGNVGRVEVRKNGAPVSVAMPHQQQNGVSVGNGGDVGGNAGQPVPKRSERFL